jgi:hypothetical protein
MNKTTYAVLGALAGFGVGIAVAYFRAQSHRALPEPTAQVGRELTISPAARPLTLPISSEDVRRLEEQMARVEADREAFEKEFSALNTEFRRRIEAVLDPEQTRQYVRLAAQVEPVRQALDLPPGHGPRDVLIGHPGPRAEGIGPTAPSVLPPEVLTSILELTFVSWSLDNLSAALALRPDQKENIRALLHERRQRFLELVDRTPPPSLRLLTIANELKARAK